DWNQFVSERRQKATVSRRAVLGGAGALAAGGALTAATSGAAHAAPAAAAAGPSGPSPFTSSPSSTMSPSVLPSLKDITHSGRRLVDYEVVELAAMLRAGVVSSVELTQAYLDRIATLNGPFETYANTGQYYNAFVRIDADAALAAARAADAAQS